MYQTLKRLNDNIDIVFAIHTFKWELKKEVGTIEEGAETVEKAVSTKEVAKQSFPGEVGEHEVYNLLQILLHILCR